MRLKSRFTDYEVEIINLKRIEISYSRLYFESSLSSLRGQPPEKYNVITCSERVGLKIKSSAYID